VIGGISQQDLRHEEIMIGGQVEWCRERDIDPDFLAGYRAFSQGGLVREREDPRIHAIGNHEAGIEQRDCEGQFVRC